jgi:hypothetical protein
MLSGSASCSASSLIPAWALLRAKAKLPEFSSARQAGSGLHSRVRPASYSA